MRSFSLVVVGLMFLAACSFREQKDGAAGGPTGTARTEGALGYARVRQDFFAPKCLGCHSGAHEPLLNDYASVRGNLDRIRQAVLVDKVMPPARKGPLAQSDLDLLQSWIDQGAPEAGSPPRDAPTATLSPAPGGAGRALVGWKALHDQVLTPACVSCHYPGNTEGENQSAISNLEDPETVRGSISTIFGLAVQVPLMPPPPKGTADGASNPNQLTREQKEILSQWIIDGMSGPPATDPPETAPKPNS